MSATCSIASRTCSVSGVKLFPALDLPAADDLILAAVDDFAATAVEERGAGARIFFATEHQRNAALAHLIARQQTASAIEVSDEDWAARSQQNLAPITVGGITIVPNPECRVAPASQVPHVRFPIPSCVITIEPSMGFGTGQHPTTRLCLLALQACAVTGVAVLDVGTGSGVLAIAAARLGAARAHGIDSDPDAVESAVRNLRLNPDARHVTFAVADLSSVLLAPADIVLANLTGASLARFAGRLRAAVASGGTVILGGVLESEEQDVRRAWRGAEWRDRAQESEWVCLTARIS